MCRPPRPTLPTHTQREITYGQNPSKTSNDKMVRTKAGVVDCLLLLWVLKWWHSMIDNKNILPFIAFRAVRWVRAKSTWTHSLTFYTCGHSWQDIRRHPSSSAGGGARAYRHIPQMMNDNISAVNHSIGCVLWLRALTLLLKIVGITLIRIAHRCLCVCVT